MAPKGKAASKDAKSDTKASASKGNAKGKGKSEANAAEDKSKVKASQFINVRHILCEKHGKKEEALEKLRAGENFGDVAKAFSEDKPRVGGLLGWKKRGDLDLAFEELAFELPTSTPAAPVYREVKTGFGYHIVMVEGRK